MSAIVAFSDVHLGWDRANSDDFMAFMKYLQGRADLGDVVIVGDLVDLWRRDIIGLEFELSKYMEELKALQKKVRVHYVVGNHDAHVEHLENHEYPFKPQTSIEINRFGYTVKFLHGHQCDPLQNILGPNTSEILCWTLSDAIGEKKSRLWEIFGFKGKLPRNQFEAQIDLLLNPPEDIRRTQAFGLVTDFVDCVKANLKITGEKEFVVFGHTHKPFIDLKKRVANTGCWIRGMNPTNTYFEFEGWPPSIVEFGKQPLKPTPLSMLRF